MSKVELLEYIRSVSHPCPKYLKAHGWHKIADLVEHSEEGKINTTLLENLIQLSDAPGHDADKKAGLEIFTSCCPDETMQEKAKDFIAQN